MASGAPTETTLIRKSLPEFKADLYASIPRGELVVFAVQLLQADGVPATTEEIVSTCFRLFPHSFSLKNYFYWPDSAQVARYLNDAKDKGFIKGNPADGFAVKVEGRQVVKQVAKTLGMSVPVPPKAEKSKPVEKRLEPEKASKPQAKKFIQKKTAPQRAKPVKKAAPKQIPPVKKAAAKTAKTKKISPAPARRKVTPKPKQKAAAKKVIPKPASKKEKTKQPRNTKKTKTAQHLPALIPTTVMKDIKPAPGKPKKTLAAKPVKAKRASRASALLTPAPVSKEEKAKAGKVVHMLERSDAYRQYKKHGGRAKISEFDFRNMLFTTMESSAETLKRNVALFKRYAGVHNRTDLINFLEFCEGGFAPILKPQAKQPAKTLKR